MSDLIESLRKVQSVRRNQTPLKTVVQLCHKAADEIERWKSDRPDWAEYQRLINENNRLRNALERIKVYTKGNLDQLPYEIAREALRDE